MIFDVEADGLLDVATKLHVLAYQNKDGTISHTYCYNEMRRVLTEAPLLIGHNIICYDVPLLEKLLGIKIKARLIDTLAMSWYLNHTNVRHGLEVYGEQFGVPKPKIDDWENLTQEKYAHRCTEDVKINAKLWQQLKTKLLTIYDDKQSADRLIEYLSFKMDCLREQEQSKWKLDVDLATRSLKTLLEQQEEKLPELIKHMPRVEKFVEKTRPAKPYKKDGSYSVTGANWFNLLKEKNLPEDFNGVIQVFHHDEEPNPNSHQQIKDWLFSMGWKPETFDYKKNDDGTQRKIPQVRVEGDEGKELCPSVLKLTARYPAILVLEGLTIIQHRISIFQGFLENHKKGFLIAGAGGLTNTLRFKHRELVNLPGVGKPWGKEIRGCLVAPEGEVLCGSDMSSLEDTTKRHYMYKYDPDYVEEMAVAGFDPHLDLAKYANVVTQEEINQFNVVKKKDTALSNFEQDLFQRLTSARKLYKPANYSCIYGVGAPKLALSIGVEVWEAQKLIDTYWKRNWAIKKLAEDTFVKKVKGEMWLYNPVSKFWYSLRYKKDIFSTLNQGTGVYCFDSWIKEIRKIRPQLTGQFHDEIILCIKKGSEEKCKQLLQQAITNVNKALKLNVQLGVDIQFGQRYSDIH